jgi:hypothetical protein
MSRSFGGTSLTTGRRCDLGAAGDLLQSRDHAQRRRLAAAGRPDEHGELAMRDMQVERMDGDDAAGVGLADLLEDDLGHDGRLPVTGVRGTVNASG